MRAGQLRQRVTIKYKTVARNSYGEEVITWTTLAKRWASVDPLRGREYLEAAQDQADVSHRVRLRHLDGITPDMRVIHDGRTLEIESVINYQERGIMLELMCREAVD